MNNENIDYDKLKESFNKIADVISKFVDQVKDIFMNVYASLKDMLNKKVSVRTKKYKKGKRYVHSYKKIKLVDYIRFVNINKYRGIV